ncbi:ATP-binding cassette domain-containing protein [Brachybacterium sp. GPGPB12]|uniref:ATP-binding cassette domain-containing protein n=1 Tax=Brachybacterium sp. GPGPB12 TaxID=3023517 RepID=UPI003134640A
MLDEHAPADGTRPAPDLAGATLALRGVSVASRDGLAPHAAEIEVRPGRITALTGPSGAGKTTAVQVSLGLLEPEQGRAEVIAADGTATDVRELERRAPLGPDRAAPPAARAPARHPARGPRRRPPGRGRRRARGRRGRRRPRRRHRPPRTRRGPGPPRTGPLPRRAAASGAGPRPALPAPLVVLDEPTAHLDGAAEQIVLDLLGEPRAQGRTVLVVAHRSRLVEAADDIVSVDSRAEVAA